MAYLCQNGKADAVLTEDSDLLVFGAPEVLFKLDSDGNVVRLTLENIFGWNNARPALAVLHLLPFFPSSSNSQGADSDEQEAEEVFPHQGTQPGAMLSAAA